MTDFRGQTDNESLRPDVLLKRIEAEIQSVRDILISAFHTEMDDWDVLCFEEPPSMLLLRQLSRLLADEANTIALHVQDQESEIESLRAAIEVEGANVRRESWRRSARERILAGENPDALPMDADMTFAEYFAQVRTLLAEIARNKPAG